MRHSIEIIEFIKNNNGIITSSDASKHNIKRGTLKYLVDKGDLIHLSRGIYSLPNASYDQYFATQNRFQKGIFTGDTALYLLGLLEDEPTNLCMTFPNTYNVTNAKKNNIFCFQASEPYYSTGVISVCSPYGNKLITYSAERTICDILKPSYSSDKKTIVAIIKKYLSSSYADVDALLSVSETMRVKKRLEPYVDILNT